MSRATGLVLSVMLLSICPQLIFASGSKYDEKSESMSEENLSIRLSRDADFQTLVTVSYKLHKVISNKLNYTQLSSYLKRNITDKNRKLLLQAFGYTKEEQLSESISEYAKLLQKVQEKYPEMLLESNRPEVLKAGEVILKRSNFRLTMGDCWVALLTWNSACYSYCAQQSQYDYNSCVWACIDTGLLIYSACWAAVEF